MSVPAEAGSSTGSETRAKDAHESRLGGQIARNSIFSVAGRAVYVVGWAAVAPYMLQRLGTERFGLWSLLNVVSSLYLTFDLGLSSALTKFVAEFRASGDHVKLRGVYTATAITYAASSLIILAAVVLFRGPILDLFRIGPSLRAEATTAIVVAVAMYSLLNFYTMYSAILSGLHRLDLWNNVSVVVTILQLAGVWFVRSRGGGLSGLFVNSGVVLALGILLCRRSVRQLAPEIRFGAAMFDPALFRRLATYGLALQVISLGVLFALQLEKVLFGSMVSLGAVTSYEFGFRVVTALWSIPSLLLPPLLPAVSHLDSTGDRARIVRLYRRASRYVFSVALPIASGILAMGPILFVAWLGPGHGDAALAAQALATMLGLNMLTGVGTAVARGIGRPWMEVRYQVIGMVAHLALALFWIPRYGYRGGLLAMVVGTTLGSLYFVWVFHRFLRESIGPFLLETFVRPLVAAGVAGLVTAWVIGVAGSIDALSRGEALGRLVLGVAVFVPVATAVLLVTRQISIAEMRGLFDQIVKRSNPTASPARAD